MSEVHIRVAVTDDFPAIAALRWQWVAEDRTDFAMTKDEFIGQFLDWAISHASTHRCIVAVRGERVIGTAWLYAAVRVPSPRSFDRLSGDVQSVYVVPEERNRGVGARILEELLREAAQLGMERVVVHSSPAAITAYQRAGFEPSERLRQAHLVQARSAKVPTAER